MLVPNDIICAYNSVSLYQRFARKSCLKSNISSCLVLIQVALLWLLVEMKVSYLLFASNVQRIRNGKSWLDFFSVVCLERPFQYLSCFCIFWANVTLTHLSPMGMLLAHLWHVSNTQKDVSNFDFLKCVILGTCEIHFSVSFTFSV